MNDLSASAVEEHLRRVGAAGRPIVVREVTGSTNDDARSAAAAGAPHGAVFLADMQTLGRGRSGHAWHSPPGENVYLSMVLRPRVSASSLPSITPAVGVAVARVLEARLEGRAPVWVKWPNDVFAGPRGEARKLAGVLLEGQLRGSEVESVTAGVGVNVRSRAFPAELVDRATSLSLLGAEELERASIAAELIAAFDATIARYEVDRLASFMEDIARLDLLRGRRVTVAGVSGVAAGVDAEGRLLVRDDEGRVAAVATGEVGERAGTAFGNEQ